MKMTSLEYYKKMAEQRPEGRSYVTNEEAYDLLVGRRELLACNANMAKALSALKLATEELNKPRTIYFTWQMVKTNVIYFLGHAKNWLDGTWPLKQE